MSLQYHFPKTIYVSLHFSCLLSNETIISGCKFEHKTGRVTATTQWHYSSNFTGKGSKMTKEKNKRTRGKITLNCGWFHSALFKKMKNTFFGTDYELIIFVIQAIFRLQVEENGYNSLTQSQLVTNNHKLPLHNHN